MKKTLLLLSLFSIFQAYAQTPISLELGSKTMVYKIDGKNGPLFTDVAPPVHPSKAETRPTAIATQEIQKMRTIEQPPTAAPPAPAASSPQNTAQINTDEDMKKEKQRQCLRAKMNQTALNAGSHLQMIDGDGNKVNLDAQGIEQEKTNAIQSVKAWCQE